MRLSPMRLFSCAMAPLIFSPGQSN
jgi:hypothetical protein